MSSLKFHHADLFEGIADAIGDRTAVICGDDRATYAELDDAATRLGNHLSAHVRPGEHVGIHLYNGLEYVTALLAVVKIRAVPVNVNYRLRRPGAALSVRRLGHRRPGLRRGVRRTGSPRPGPTGCGT